jgi:metal-responsive CopG/Arc/MetJ family transcriptional regulator
MRRNKKISISISQPLLDALSESAKQKGLPLSSYIRSLILESIKTNTFCKKDPKRRISIALSQEEYKQLTKLKDIDWEKSLRRVLPNKDEIQRN